MMGSKLEVQMASLNYFNGKLFSDRLYHFEPSGVLSLNVTWWEHEVKFVEKNDDLSLSLGFMFAFE